MGCASAVNRKDDDDTKRIIRIDLQTIKSTVTPKNEINLMKLTEQLLKVLEALCGDDKAKYDKL
jgi:ribosomal protein L28